ncbi:MAG TPA: PIN domain-containing protein [Anaerolineae bacterium]
MTDRILVDTNVVVYAYDRSEPAKQAQALTVLNELAGSRAGVLSAQVLSEFFNAVTRRIVDPLTFEEAYARVRNLMLAWPVLDITPLIVLEAARGAVQHQMRIWDAQIWATARLNQIPVIFSEDFSDGAVVEGIRTVNPFGRQFQMNQWI